MGKKEEINKKRLESYKFNQSFNYLVYKYKLSDNELLDFHIHSICGMAYFGTKTLEEAEKKIDMFMQYAKNFVKESHQEVDELLDEK